MRKTRRVALSLVLAMALMLVLAFPAGAANPTVSITVTAEVVSITNTQSTWAIGTVATTATVYFSTDGNQDDDWSQVENTGSVAVLSYSTYPTMVYVPSNVPDVSQTASKRVVLPGARSVTPCPNV